MIRIGNQYDVAVPEGVNETLLRLGGVTPHGTPRYRCVWGWKRLEVRHEEWNDYDAEGRLVRRVEEVRLMPKYLTDPERFYFEAWFPPEAYGTPESWFLTTREYSERGLPLDRLGEFPRMGEYESIWKCEGTVLANGKATKVFARPVPETARRVVMLHHATLERSRQLIESDLRAAEEKKKKGRLAMAKDVIRDAHRAFHYATHVALPGKPLPGKASGRKEIDYGPN